MSRSHMFKCEMKRHLSCDEDRKESARLQDRLPVDVGRRQRTSPRFNDAIMTAVMFFFLLSSSAPPVLRKPRTGWIRSKLSCEVSEPFLRPRDLVVLSICSDF